MSSPAGAGDSDAGWEPSSAELAHRSDPQVGTAYAVSVRTDANPVNHARSETVLTFRVRRAGPAGQDLPPVAIEMRGPVLSGMIAEGDQIRLPAPVPHGGALQLTSVTNLTTHSQVTTKVGGLPKGVQIALLVVFFAVFLLVLGIVLVGFLTVGSGF